MDRRKFLKYMGAAGVGATMFWHGDTLFGLRGGKKEALAAIPGGTLDPKVVPKYVTPLVIPPVMPNNGTANVYSIAVKQFTQQILPGGPGGFPVTNVWSYGASGNLAGTLNYPAFTIEAVRGTPTTVTWINGLVDGFNNYLPHLLPVDQTLHWANPPGGTAGRDMRPDFTTTPGPYLGPVPIITHVHGMERVADWSDGYAEAWFLPNAGNIPAGYAPVGTWYNFFQGKATTGPWAAGTATFAYPNSQRPSTAWYHDHTLGMTRLNGPTSSWTSRMSSSAKA